MIFLLLLSVIMAIFILAPVSFFLESNVVVKIDLFDSIEKRFYGIELTHVVVKVINMCNLPLLLVFC